MQGDAAALEEAHALGLAKRAPPAQPLEERGAGRQIRHAQSNECKALLHPRFLFRSRND